MAEETLSDAFLILEQTEEKVACLLEIIADVLDKLQVVGPVEAAEIKRSCEEYAKTVHEIHQTLVFHIKTSSVERSYKRNVYGDYHHFKLSAQKTELVLTQLRAIQAQLKGLDKEKESLSSTAFSSSSSSASISSSSA